MTYCLAAAVDEGLVFASDSRTNAGIDNVSTHRKMHTFEWPGERVFVLLSAGNLATTQGVVRTLSRDVDDAAAENLATLPSLDDAAEYLGRISVERQAQASNAASEHSQVSLEATFILGGQIVGQAPSLHLIYPEGNFITVSAEQPFLQIGETKYGKPILDRIIRGDTPIESAGLAALVSIDSTMRSNLSVGPPVDLLLYRNGTLSLEGRRSFSADDPYFLTLRDSWGEGLKRVFATLPPMPAASTQP